MSVPQGSASDSNPRTPSPATTHPTTRLSALPADIAAMRARPPKFPPVLVAAAAPLTSAIVPRIQGTHRGRSFGRKSTAAHAAISTAASEPKPSTLPSRVPT